MDRTRVARSRMDIDSGSWMVDGGVIVIRWRLHGLGEAEVCMLVEASKVSKIFLLVDTESGVNKSSVSGICCD